MRRLYAPLILVAALGATPCVVWSQTPHASAAAVDVLRKLDTILETFAPTLGGYPPNVKSKNELRTVEKRWKSAAATVARLRREFPKDAQVLWRAGNFYRMGHNLDQDDAWTMSEKCCKTALGLDPKCAPAHLTLGTLYVNTDPSRAPAAEKEFRSVVDLADAKSLPAARRGLVFACYYQAKFREAASEADAYLKLRPDDAQIQGLKTIAEEQARKSGRGERENPPCAEDHAGCVRPIA